MWHFFIFFSEITILVFLVYIIFFSFFLTNVYKNWLSIFSFYLFIENLFFIFIFLIFIKELYSLNFLLNFTSFLQLHTIFIINEYIINLKIIFIFIILILILLLNSFFFENRGQFYEYLIFIIFIFLSVLFILNSINFYILYILIELLSISFYLLIITIIKDLVITESGFKFFLLGIFSSIFFLFGLNLIYGFFGIINFIDFKYLFLNIISSGGYLLIMKYSFIFILSFIFFKLMIFPFHFWAPDVYESVSFILLLFIGIIPKLIFILILLKFFFYYLMNFVFIWNISILFLSCLTILFGTFSALVQLQLKRLLVYSSMVHLGYLLVGFSFFSFESLFITIFYLISYLILTYGIFSILLNIKEYFGFFNFIELKNIRDLSYLFKINLNIVFSFIFLLFSLAGIPPFLGFFSKFFIFWLLLSMNNYFISFIFIFFSLVSVLYYLRLIKLLFNFYLYKRLKWSFFFFNFLKSYLIIWITFMNCFILLWLDIIFLSIHNIVLSTFF